MEAAIQALKKSLGTIRAGRASISMLDTVRVAYYGQETPLNQVATLSIPDPSVIVVQPWDVTVSGDVEKAILKANLGLTPMSDGKVIRVPIPPLTEERRVELTKKVREMAEEAKTSVRHSRRDGNEELKVLEKKKEISEDELHKALKKVQEQTDTFIKEVDTIIKSKEEELMEIG